MNGDYMHLVDDGYGNLLEHCGSWYHEHPEAPVPEGMIRGNYAGAIRFMSGYWQDSGTVRTLTPQQFVDQQNHALMPKRGYELVQDEEGSFWGMPEYDHSQYDRNDKWDGKRCRGYEESIAAQRKRGVPAKYSTRYPADEATRAKVRQ